MKTHRCLALLALVSCTLVAQLPANLEKKLDEKVTSSLHKAGAPSVSVAVVEDGKLVYAKAFGMADLAAGRASRRATRWDRSLSSSPRLRC